MDSLQHQAKASIATTIVLKLRHIAPNWPGIAIRVLTILGKFALVAYFTRYLTLYDLGVYSVFAATVTLSLYLVSIEFYTYSTREILKSDNPSERTNFLQNQIVLHIFLYFAASPLLAMVFVFDLLPGQFAGLFVVILFCSHLTLETQRLLIVMSRPLAAYLVLAVMHGFWTYPAILFSLLIPQLRNLTFFLVIWSISGLIAVTTSIIFLWKSGILKIVPKAPDLTWIKRGIKVSAIFLVSALAYRFIELSDRYFLQYYWSETEVGIFSFYSSIANVLTDFIMTGVVAATYPLMVTSFQRNEFDNYQKHRRTLNHQVFKATVVLTPLFLGGIYVLLWFINRPELNSNIAVYFVLLATAIVVSVSLGVHYELFSQKLDKHILVSVLLGMLTKFVLNMLWIPQFGILGAAWATLLAFASVGICKFLFAAKSSRKSQSSL